MAYSIEVTRDTYEKVALAARMTGSTPGDIIEKIVASVSSAIDSEPPPTPGGEMEPLSVQATYEGHRTTGDYYPLSKRIQITSGPLTGRSFRTPSSAARAVIESLNPRVNSNRNGWSFWQLSNGGEPLQSVRH